MARTEAAAEAFDRDRKRAIERAGSPLTGEAISAPNTVILYFQNGTTVEIVMSNDPLARPSITELALSTPE
jgi:hypothetical protein